MSKPWEQLEEESAKAYEAFCIYRDMGSGRSYREVAESLQKSETLIGRWGRTHSWIKRAEAWDGEQDRIARKAQLNEIAKMRKRHAKLATTMLAKAAAALENIPEEDIKPGDVSRMVEVAYKLERLARGDTSEVIEERQGEDAPPAVTFYMPDNGRNPRGDSEGDLDEK